ncbi:MAG TPA: MobF family relaxase [Candidatus Dormibacteraeota bacterium]
MAQSEGVVHAIKAGDAAGAARYFAGERQERGDYYLDREGRRGEPPGTWLGNERALRELGLAPGSRIREEQLLALMEGRNPATGARVRQPARTGTAIVAHDVHWAPPKSASLAWAYATPQVRQQIEAAFRAACAVGVEELQKLPLLRGYEDGRQVGMPGGLVVAQFVHHTARLAQGQHEPDPQLHAHHLVLVGQRDDGRWSAITNYHVMRNRARINALVMGEFAYRLRELGFGIRSTERGGWELEGNSPELIERNSKRRRDIEAAAERAGAVVRASMRRDYLEVCRQAGREPAATRLKEIERFQLDPVAKRPLGRTTRGSKAEIPLHADLHRHWRERDGVSAEFVDALRHSEHRPGGREVTKERLRRELIREAGLLEDGERLDAAVRLASAGEQELGVAAAHLAQGDLRAREVAPLTEQVLAGLLEEGRLVKLVNGRYATPAQIAVESKVLDGWRAGRKLEVGVVDAAALARARSEVESRRGIQLTDDQQRAIEVMTSPGAVVAITGDAGTGKGVAAEVAIRAWQLGDHQVIGIAHANAIARRLEPLGVDLSMSVHMLLSQVDRGELKLDRRSVLLLDEATMVDTALLARLERARAEAGAKLVQLGDDKQLGSISAGGLFALAQANVPHARLTSMVRYREPWLAEAVREQGEGRSERALKILERHGALQWWDSAAGARDQAVELWRQSRERGLGAEEVKIVVASSNRETDRLNRLVQAARRERGELGPEAVDLPGRGMAVHEGDLVVFRAHHRQPGGERVVNGTSGRVVAVDARRGRVRVLTDERRPRSVVVEPGRFFREAEGGGERECGLRAGYAVHVQPGQGMTVRHAIGVVDWQSGRESATVQMSRGAERFDLVVNSGSALLEGEPDVTSAVSAQLTLSTAGRAALDQRQPLALTPKQQRLKERQLSIAASVVSREASKGRELERERDRERER